MNKLKKNKHLISAYIVSFFAVAFTLLPITWLFMLSIKSKGETFTKPPKLIFEPTANNYIKLWDNDLFKDTFFNSIFITLISIVLSITIALFAAYALKRYQIRFKNAFMQWLHQYIESMGPTLPISSKSFSDRGKTSPMRRRHAEARNSLAVLFRAVARIPFPAISRVAFGKIRHHPVAGNLGHDGSRSDGKRTTVAFDHGHHLAIEIWRPVSINESSRGTDRQRVHSAPHCKHGRMKDVQRINFLRRRDPDTKLGDRLNLHQKRLPQLALQLLRIVRFDGVLRDY